MIPKSKDHPTISIITVVYNSFIFIEETIKSILNQTYTNIQYILIDGFSTDGTWEIIKKYEDRLSLCISEKDKGIYDAMNKGLDLAKGEYVLFINAGDKLKNPNTIENIFSNNPPSDIYYGEVENINASGTIIGKRRLKSPNVLDWKSFRWGMLVSHQAFICKRSLSSHYNINFKISADIDWCINCMKKAKIITNTHQIISDYLIGGTSRQYTILSWKERYKIMMIHYGRFNTFLYHIWIVIRFIVNFIGNGKLD